MNEWLLGLHNPWIIYGILFIVLMGGAVGLPVPEDLPLISAGILAERGNVKVSAALLTCYLGVLTGDFIIYLIGKRFGPALFDVNWFKSRFPPRRISNIKRSLEKRSLLMIFIARHLFYLRTATFLTCGAVKMKVFRFVAADATAALISVPLMLWIGYKCAEHYETAVKYANEIKIWSLVLAILLVACFVIVRRKGSTDRK